MKCCHKCGAPWLSSLRVPGVKEICETCDAYLHCCRNCRHHRRGLPNQCYIPNTEAVADRAGCNFCDDFEFHDADVAAKDRDAEARARAQALGLLGAAGGEETALRDALLEDRPARKDPRAGLDDLFGS